MLHGPDDEQGARRVSAARRRSTCSARRSTVQVAPTDDHVRRRPARRHARHEDADRAAPRAATGFIYTDNGMPNMDPANGHAARPRRRPRERDDGEFVAIGMLNLSMPASGGHVRHHRDRDDLAADDQRGPGRRPDEPHPPRHDRDVHQRVGSRSRRPRSTPRSTSRSSPRPTATASRSSSAPRPSTSTVLDDIANMTRFTNADLSKAVEICLDARSPRSASCSAGIPLPAVAGLQMRNLSIGSDDGYVMMKGDVE